MLQILHNEGFRVLLRESLKASCLLIPISWWIRTCIRTSIRTHQESPDSHHSFEYYSVGEKGDHPCFLFPFLTMKSRIPFCQRWSNISNIKDESVSLPEIGVSAAGSVDLCSSLLKEIYDKMIYGLMIPPFFSVTLNSVLEALVPLERRTTTIVIEDKKILLRQPYPFSMPLERRDVQTETYIKHMIHCFYWRDTWSLHNQKSRHYDNSQDMIWRGGDRCSWTLRIYSKDTQKILRRQRPLVFILTFPPEKTTDGLVFNKTAWLSNQHFRVNM